MTTGKTWVLWAISLVLALASCGTFPGAGLFKPQAAATGAAIAAPSSPDIKPLDMGTIQTQTLAPAQTGSGAGPSQLPSPSPRLAAEPVTQAAQSPALAVIRPAALNAAATNPANAAIGAAAIAALQAGASASSAATLAATGAAPNPAAALNPAPVAKATPLSPQQAACINQGGRWGRAGTSSAMACFHPAKDAGKSCRKEDDCTSQCLARSRSCAPFWPIFGCTEVIQNNGAVVNLCLE